ncbi:Fructose-1,6-bisphosphatase class 1 [Galdieria sulphuraria]|nr:Fructose-1,6-bisphosphatase class 1 [Galdieria sulphuraria]
MQTTGEPQWVNSPPQSPIADSKTLSALEKAGVVFSAHVRQSFRLHPSDFTGELIRLLDDLSTETHSISALVNEGSEHIQYGYVGNSLNAEFVTQQLYHALSHDGYACVFLFKDHPKPYTCPSNMPHGDYVICLSPLEYDLLCPQQSICGRSIDLQQCAKEQIAAGYCLYSSTTTFFYTMGNGVYEFLLHPVAKQYFQSPSYRLQVPQTETLWGERSYIRNCEGFAREVASHVLQENEKTFHTGSLIGDFDSVLRMGGVLLARNVHFLCEAAPLAYIMEQANGQAVTSLGKRILDIEVGNDPHKKIDIVMGNFSIHKV